MLPRACTQVLSKYDEETFELFQAYFLQMPLAAVQASARTAAAYHAYTAAAQHARPHSRRAARTRTHGTAAVRHTRTHSRRAADARVVASKCLATRRDRLVVY